MSQTTLSQEAVRRLIDQCDQALVKIAHCLKQLTDEQVWLRPAGSENSIGNLLVHVAGNLRQWGIVPLTAQQDLRDREREFTQSELIPRNRLFDDLKRTLLECYPIWRNQSADQLLAEVCIQGFDISVYGALVHTVAHLVGHTHQIILLTRQHLGEAYQFQWTPDAPRKDVPL